MEESQVIDYIYDNINDFSTPLESFPLSEQKLNLESLDNFDAAYQEYKMGKNHFGMHLDFQKYIRYLIDHNKFLNYEKKVSKDLYNDLLIGISLNKLRNHIPNFSFTYKSSDCMILGENTYNTISFEEYIENCNEEELKSLFIQYENALYVASTSCKFIYNSENLKVRKFENPFEINIYLEKEESIIVRKLTTNVLLILEDYSQCSMNVGNYRINNFEELNYNTVHTELEDTLRILRIIKTKRCDYFFKIQKEFFISMEDENIIKSKMFGYRHQFILDYLTRERVTPYLSSLKPLINFEGKIMIIGCGSVGRCVLPLLLKLISIHPSRVTVLDMLDNRKFIEDYIKLGVKYIQTKIVESNYIEILNSNLGRGDFLLDLAYNIDTLYLLRWCNKNGVMFANTSIEDFEPYENVDTVDPRTLTLYYRQEEIANDIKNWENNNTSMIVDSGFNPGHVSVLVKQGLLDIAAYYGVDISDLEEFSEIAQRLNVQVIQISERDTQLSHIPKKVSEFVGTWSVEGLREEAMSLAELSLGTHEKKLPSNSILHEKTGSAIGSAMSLSSMGMNTMTRSYVPGSEINGYLIRHGESITISKSLSIKKGNKIVYSPTCYYSYCPCDSTLNSLHEFRMNDYTMKGVEDRILYDEITEGSDSVGCLIMGPKIGSWWIGSILDIHETRQIIGYGHNATVLQVAAHFVSTVIYMITNPNLGFMFPDDLDHRFILDIAQKFMGDYTSKKVDWSPTKSKNDFMVFGKNIPKEEDAYQFDTFLVRTDTYSI